MAMFCKHEFRYMKQNTIGSRQVGPKPYQIWLTGWPEKDSLHISTIREDPTQFRLENPDHSSLLADGEKVNYEWALRND